MYLLLGWTEERGPITSDSGGEYVDRSEPIALFSTLEKAEEYAKKSTLKKRSNFGMYRKSSLLFGCSWHSIEDNYPLTVDPAI